MHIQTHIHIHTHIHAHMHQHLHLHLHMRIPVQTHICTRMFATIASHLRTNVHVYICRRHTPAVARKWQADDLPIAGPAKAQRFSRTIYKRAAARQACEAHHKRLKSKAFVRLPMGPTAPANHFSTDNGVPPDHLFQPIRAYKASRAPWRSLSTTRSSQSIINATRIETLLGMPRARMTVPASP